MKKKFQILILSLLATFGVNNLKAQWGDFTVSQCQDSMDVINLFDSVFFSNLPSQNYKNLTFQGDPTAVGYFENGYFLGMENGKGIVLTTGHANDADKSNVCGTEQNASTNNIGVENDEDLELLLGSGSHDACIIEFDFKPVTNYVEYNYVFASEEYNEYVNFGFNDGFGLFIGGNGISGPYSNNSRNIALLPDSTTVVSINHINKGKAGETCTGPPTFCTNCEYYINSSETTDPAFSSFAYDAYTTKLTAYRSITHNEWYHIKIAVGDAGDSVYDSAIFLEKKSFKSGSITASPWQKSMR
ncbi:MAG: hypothetical protein C0595_11300 [Marinilabiliales bacterium]|nr:MAG: hypothetical protein C0595_11300 [Marinilabiliales bacterium]